MNKHITFCPRKDDVIIRDGVHWLVSAVFPLIDRGTDGDGYTYLIQRDGESEWITAWDADEVEIEVYR